MASSANKAKNSLLFLTQTLDELKSNLKHLLEESFKYTNENLYIYINPLINNDHRQQQVVPQVITDRLKLKYLLHNFYQKSHTLNPKINVTCLLNNVHAAKMLRQQKLGLIDYDMILTDLSQSSHTNLIQFCVANLPTAERSTQIPIYSISCSFDPTESSSGQEPEHESVTDQIAANKVYKSSIMGGTFDRLHIGHKIMLSEAALLTENRLLVGVTNECMLGKKKLSELIEPFEVRSENVKTFLNTIAPALEVLPVNISDPFGPSVVERDYQCLVVSRETLRTGELVNAKRADYKLAPLEIHVVELISDEHLEEGDENKVSSSNERRHLLGTLLKAPYVPFDPSKPYVIGLTGGLASGKSTIRKDLESLGAATIDCDKLGHQTYEKDTEAYKKIITTFGEEILDENKLIDRKKLGAKVFNNKEELKKLTDVVWPEIQNLVTENIAALFSQGHKIIVVEAALLIDANWNEGMNEVWVCFVPDEEAISRSVVRDGSNAERIQGILNSQMKNKDRIARANVVLCSLWEREYTVKQVHKAWKSLQERTINSKL